MKIFITGGTSGIGLELTKIYLTQGHHLAICGRDINKVPQEIQALPKLKIYQLDVTEREKLLAAIEDFGKSGLDLIIANAGISVGNKTSLPNFEASRKVLNINIFGVLNAFEGALKIMVPQKQGHLVAISSVAGFVGLPGASSYSASKAAVTKICESYSIDLKKHGINVSNICPGFIDTPLTQKNIHKMPWLIDAQEGAQKIVKAISHKKVLYIFPWQMFLVITFLEKIPRWAYRWLMAAGPFNYSK